MEALSSVLSLPNSLSWVALPVLGLTLFLAYLAVIGIYRLYFHPLAAYPGPKLAALTPWYEFYYDVVLDGKFLFQRQKLHATYGMRQSSRS